MQKPCRKCGADLPLSSFYEHAAMRDGHLNVCKECTRKRVAERAKREPEKIRAYERKRWDDLDRRKAVYASLARARKRDPERFAGYQQESKKRHPEKVKARYALSNALRDGKIQRGKCEDCGRSGKKKGRSVVHAHHSDYSKPLLVTWLCSRCHGLRHRTV